jgi:hypothetical protein
MEHQSCSSFCWSETAYGLPRCRPSVHGFERVLAVGHAIRAHPPVLPDVRQIDLEQLLTRRLGAPGTYEKRPEGLRHDEAVQVAGSKYLKERKLRPQRLEAQFQTKDWGNETVDSFRVLEGFLHTSTLAYRRLRM